jgi:hypothetical protein
MENLTHYPAYFEQIQLVHRRDAEDINTRTDRSLRLCGEKREKLRHIQLLRQWNNIRRTLFPPSGTIFSDFRKIGSLSGIALSGNLA